MNRSGSIAVATNQQLQFGWPERGVVSPVFDLVGQAFAPWLVVSSDGSTALALLESELCRYRDNGDVTCWAGVHGGAYSLESSEELQKLLVTSDHGDEFRLHLWDIGATPRLQEVSWAREGLRVGHGEWSPDGRYFAWQAYEGERAPYTTTFWLWDREDDAISQLSTPQSLSKRAGGIRFVDDQRLRIQIAGEPSEPPTILYWDVGSDTNDGEGTLPCLGQPEFVDPLGSWALDYGDGVARRCREDGTLLDH